MKEIKTNVMRILDSKKITYESKILNIMEALDGVTCSQLLSYPQERTFKTLVTVGKSGEHYVFDIPVNEKLDLKKAALAVNEKNIEMVPFKNLLDLTGYVHGGCSPIGMKKSFKTIFHNTCLNYDRILVSGGKIGYFVEINPNDLNKVVNINFSNIIEGE